MMHKWDSVQQMVDEWENQDIGDPFVYKDFQYDLQEFDNVPPLFPRFLFRIQLYLKSLTVFMKKLKDGQQVEQLRDETIELIHKNKGNINKVEQGLQEQTDVLKEKIVDLQKQIN